MIFDFLKESHFFQVTGWSFLAKENQNHDGDLARVNETNDGVENETLTFCFVAIETCIIKENFRFYVLATLI